MKKILIVEDDAHIGEMLCQLLRQNGYTPVAAYSGTDALLTLPQGGFALILLDLMLPGKTGEEVLGELRAVSSVPVIVLTARTDKESVMQYQGVKYGIKLSSKNVRRAGNVESLPLYMAMFL